MRRFLVGLMVFLALVNQAAADITVFNSPPYNLQNGTTADATQVMANINQIIANGNANAAAKGNNSSITALTALNSPPTGQGSEEFYGTTVAGTANAITVGTTYPSGMSLVAGNCIKFKAAGPNTGATTLNVLSTGNVAVQRKGPNGATALTGGEFGANGDLNRVCYDGTVWKLQDPSNSVEMPETFTNLASAATTVLSSANCPNLKCSITGTTGITAFSSSAVVGQIFYLRFVNVLTITYNAVSLITPLAGNITTAPNDVAMAVYLGSGNWQILRYDVAVQPIQLIGSVAPYSRNLIIVNNGVTPNTKVDVTADTAVLTNSTLTGSQACLNVSLTINAGTVGANGIDAGSLANTTWYYVYIIGNNSTCSGLISASATAPTLPNGYSYYNRVGAISTDGSATFFRVRQAGNRAQYTPVAATNTPGLPLILNGSTGAPATPTWTAFQVTGAGKAMPPTASQAVIVFGEAGSATNGVMLAPSNNYGTLTSTSNPPPCATGLGSTVVTIFTCILVLESNSVYAASDAGANTRVFTLGWVDSVATN